MGERGEEEKKKRQKKLWYKKRILKWMDQRVMCMWSLLPNDRLQFGHLREREVRRSSTQSLQKTWPQVLMTVFLKLRRQTVHRASV